MEFIFFCHVPFSCWFLALKCLSTPPEIPFLSAVSDYVASQTWGYFNSRQHVWAYQICYHGLRSSCLLHHCLQLAVHPFPGREIERDHVDPTINHTSIETKQQICLKLEDKKKLMQSQRPGRNNVSSLVSCWMNLDILIFCWACSWGLYVYKLIWVWEKCLLFFPCVLTLI